MHSVLDSNRAEPYPETMRRPRLLMGSLVFVAALLPGRTAGQEPNPTPRPLPGDSTAVQTLRGGELHRYQIVLGSHRFVRVRVQQRGIDVVVTLRGPRGDSLAAVDSPNGTDGPEPLAFISGAKGDYVIEIAALEPAAAPGNYTIAVPENRGVRPSDPDRILGEVALAAGKAAIVQQTRATFEEALRQYRIALAAFEAAGDSAAAAEAILRIGDAQNRLGSSGEALPLLERGIAMAERVGEMALQLDLLNQAGRAAHNLRQPTRAIEYFRRVRVLARESGNRSMEASALNNTAEPFHQLGMLDSAVASFEQALAIFRQMGDKSGEAPVLNNLAYIYQLAGQMDRALEAYHLALDLARELHVRAAEMAILGNLGAIYAYLSADDQAIIYRRRALEIARELGSHQAEATALNNLAASYVSLADTAAAIGYLQEALELGEKLGDRAVLASVNEILGKLLAARTDQLEAALDHLQLALELWRATGDQRREASTFEGLAELQSFLGRTAEARESYGRALTLMRQNQQRTDEVRTLGGMARLAQKEGDLARADTLSNEALDLVERIRIQVGDRRLRTTFQSSAHGAYRTRISVLMALHGARPSAGHDRAAAEIAERARARGLLDALADNNVNVSQGIDPATVSRERELGIRVDSLARVLRRMAGGESGAAASSVREALDHAVAEQQRLRNDMRATNPSYVALSGAPLNVTEVQALLDSESVLLSYADVGEDYYSWVITRGAVQGFKLTNSRGLAGLVRRYRRALGESPAAWSARLGQRATHARALADSLSRILLAPAAQALGSRRILVMGSGVLQYLPFGALPVPAGVVGAGQALVTRHEVVYLPSVSTIGVLRQLRADRPVPPKTVAVLADPVFAPDDPRVRPHPGVQAQTPTADPLSSWRASLRGLEGDGPLPRLRFSRVEADAIAALVAPDARLLALDFDANRSLVLSPALHDYRIIHFATHGFVNSDYPGFSGVALSMVGRNGESEDGFLRLDQIYGLNLPVDLVVLSACQTALGKDVKGEGLVGLTRGFLYAGAASVLATLWKVDDQASAELMKRFYHLMLGPARLAPSAALRAAQADLARQPRWRDPYYWAGYVLQGDWQ